MNRPVILRPEIPIDNWYNIASNETVEDQIINALIEKMSPDSKEKFFNASLKDIPNPESLKDVDKAIDLFLKAVRNGSKILVMGDYDVDGITSTALLIRFFKKLKYNNFDAFIPNRFTHGYGLTDKSVEEILSRKPDLVITVDNGITAKNEIAKLKEAGIEVIVTDHHLPQKEFLPDCAILNPKQETCGYPFKHLSGVGVVFLFLIAIRSKLREKGYWLGQDEEPNLLEHLDLVALGTIADQVPLLGLNRIFAKFGLSQMTKKIHDGQPTEFSLYLRAFAQKNKLKSFNSESIAFSLAPLLNATGRMKDAEDGLSFILSEDNQIAMSRYQHLDRLNQKRRKKQQVMVKKAVEQAEALLKQEQAIVVYNKSFHEGLIGIIASRLVDQYLVPSIVVTEGESGILKASCRSKNENIMEMLEACDEFLIQYGGHPQAAGFSLKREHLKSFHKRFTEVCSELIPKGKDYVIKANIEVNLEMMTYSLLEKLRVMEPYGHENRKPIFYMKNVALPVPNILTGKHLKWSFSSDLELIYWNGADILKHAPLYDLAFTLGENNYRGERKRQLVAQSMVSKESGIEN